MTNESLSKAADAAIKAVSDADIDTCDKVELLLNLLHFLDIKRYRHNIDVLTKDEVEHKHCKS